LGEGGQVVNSYTRSKSFGTSSAFECLRGGRLRRHVASRGEGGGRKSETGEEGGPWDLFGRSGLREEGGGEKVYGVAGGRREAAGVFYEKRGGDMMESGRIRGLGGRRAFWILHRRERARVKKHCGGEGTEDRGLNVKKEVVQDQKEGGP